MSTKDDAKRQKYLQLFGSEADEHLLALGDLMLALEKNPQDKESLQNALRRVHTLKGSSQLLGLVDVARAAHAFEDNLKLVERGERAIDGRLIDGLLDGVDVLRALVDQVRPALPPTHVSIPPPAPPGPSLVGPSDEPVGPVGRHETNPPAGAVIRSGSTIRVEVDKLDALFNAVSALSVGRARVERAVSTCRSLIGRAKATRTRDPIYAELQRLYDGLSQSAYELDLAVRDVQDLTVGMRLLPCSTLLSDYPRKVRDLARELGKEVRLIIEGGETECDKDLIDALGDPLVHLVRNAVDHGIEAPEKRVARGKPREGTVAVRAQARGANLILEVEDDGAGIAVSRVKSEAVRLGLVDSDAAARMSDAEAVYLVTRTGLTTRDTPTSVSGRGIGMDVVRATVAAWKGDLAIDSELGRGTRYTLTLPISLATMRVLLVECEARTYALPLGSIALVLRLDTEDHPSLRLSGELVLRGEHVRLVQLRALLGERPEPLRMGDQLPVLVLRHGMQRVAVVVDRLLHDEEVVIKALPVPEGASPLVGGATFLADGRIALILSVPRLLATCGERSAGTLAPVWDEPEAPRRSVLVVDDSFTTRVLEQSILESSGYEVELAISAEDALEKLERRGFDLIVTDVQMPGRDGFELVRLVRSDARHGKTPCIVVSSLASPAERERGRQVGAQEYIVKGEFEQETLLQAVARLIG